VSAPGLSIPFYSHVEEGKNLPFDHYGKCVVRTARIHPDPTNSVNWMERHSRLTQVWRVLSRQLLRVCAGEGSACVAFVLASTCSLSRWAAGRQACKYGAPATP
jgi:hypothetical protein